MVCLLGPAGKRDWRLVTVRASFGPSAQQHHVLSETWQGPSLPTGGDIVGLSLLFYGTSTS